MNILYMDLNIYTYIINICIAQNISEYNIISYTYIEMSTYIYIINIHMYTYILLEKVVKYRYLKK